MKKWLNIRTLITHMYTVSKDFFQGSECGNNWFFYHDALSLMCNKEVKLWIHQQGIL